MSDETTEDFDWTPLGSGFWLEAQKTCGASDAQMKFACARHRGMTATGAARAAGYAGDDNTLRQAGHRAAKSNAVMNMMALAQAVVHGGDDGTVGTAEARRILSRLARGSDPAVKIRALECLSRMDREEWDRNAAITPTHDPLGDLRELAKISPQLAAQIARDRGIPWDEEAVRPATNGAHAPALAPAAEEGAADAT